MKNSVQAFSLSLLLACPFLTPVQAQLNVETTNQVWQQVQGEAAPAFIVVNEGMVAQTTDDDRAFRAYANSIYSYWDAAVLASYWGQSVWESKSYIGHKLLGGYESKALLEQRVLDARIKALAGVSDLKYFYDAGYSYDDAVVLSEFWGDSDTWQTKLRVERNIIMGNNENVRRDLTFARPHREHGEK